MLQNSPRTYFDLRKMKQFLSNPGTLTCAPRHALGYTTTHVPPTRAIMPMRVTS